MRQVYALVQLEAETAMGILSEHPRAYEPLKTN